MYGGAPVVGDRLDVDDADQQTDPFARPGERKDSRGTRRSILGFLDSLYAGAITFAFALGANEVIAEMSKLGAPRVLWRLLPAMVATAYMADDWINARPILERYGYAAPSYHARIRLWTDMLILVLAFFWITLSMVYDAVVYLGLFAGVCFLGWLWARLIQAEMPGVSDWEVRAIRESHRVMAIVVTCVAITVGLVNAVLQELTGPLLMAERVLAPLFVVVAAGIYKLDTLRLQREEVALWRRT